MTTKIINASPGSKFAGAWGVFSECDRYRYLLAIPTGVDNERIVTFCLANPSTATPDQLDPTLTRCLNYAKRWGFGWMWIVNVRAWRETDPKKVPGDPEAIGPVNFASVMRASKSAELVVCGWGKLGGRLGLDMASHIDYFCGKKPHALKLNKDGSPAHPLYLRSDLVPFAMEVT